MLHGTKNFLNENLYPYSMNIWEKCEKIHKCYMNFFKAVEIILIKIEETGPVKVVIHMSEPGNFSF